MFNNGWADSLTLEKQAMKMFAKMNEFMTIRVIVSLVLLSLQLIVIIKALALVRTKTDQQKIPGS